MTVDIVYKKGEHYLLTPWWKNFINSTPNTKFFDQDSVNRALSPYRARFIYDSGSIGLLEFDTEQDYVMFVLKWS